MAEQRKARVPPALVALLNKVDPTFIIFSHVVPLRIQTGPKRYTAMFGSCIRVIADVTFRTFRVEQLVMSNKDMNNPHGTWTTLSTHGSETAGVMLDTAMKAAVAAQNKLRSKIEKRVAGKRIIRP